MGFRIVSLPPFRAASSGVDQDFDFSPEGILGKFKAYFSAIKPSPRDSFTPRDFLLYDKEGQGFVWWLALSDDIEDGGHDIVEFEGGYYLTYSYRDGDDEEHDRLYSEAIKYIEESGIFALDERPNHYSMGHIITPAEVIEAQGWAQMEVFIPIKLIG